MEKDILKYSATVMFRGTPCSIKVQKLEQRIRYFKKCPALMNSGRVKEICAKGVWVKDKK